MTVTVVVEDRFTGEINILGVFANKTEADRCMRRQVKYVAEQLNIEPSHVIETAPNVIWVDDVAEFWYEEQEVR